VNYDKIMIVAHPDDEIIFGGAQLIQENDWLVICITNGDNEIRRKEFEMVMKKVNAEYEIWNYPDKWDGDFDRPRLLSDLKEVLARKPVEKVVTHNLEGEYGHTQHKVISMLVQSLVDKNFYVFDIAEKKLDENILRKKQILVGYYKSQEIASLKKYIQHEGIKKIL